MFTEQQIKDIVTDGDLNASMVSLGTQNFFGSFPVDVIVFIRVEPSIIRFNCLPDSKVECLLQVNNESWSLCLMFGSQSGF